MARVIALAAVMLLGSASIGVAASPPNLLAQYSSQAQQESDGSSSRTRVRPRGLFKIIGLGAVAVIAVGGFIYKKVKGG